MSVLKENLKGLLGKRSVTLARRFKELLFVIADIAISPLTLIYAQYFRMMRERSFYGMPLGKKILFTTGVFPIIDHYYEPMFNHEKHLRKPLKEKRNLPGIDFDVHKQIEIVDRFDFGPELLKMPLEGRGGKKEFSYLDGPFPPADAEYLYNIIRFFKPKRIIEIGSGHSTLMAIKAIGQNKSDDANYSCLHICIEPYENDWLEELGVQVVREKVENCDLSLFSQLEENDILFIDSTHIIRPQGDVLFEYLEILPSLQSGVLIHIHDIFTPHDYPEEWVFYGNRLWNEQYLLEAFLTCNDHFSIIGSTNFLLHNHFDDFKRAHPVSKMLTEQGMHVGAGSFWLRKN